VIRYFDNHFVQSGDVQLVGSFNDRVLQINKNEPTEEFAKAYLKSAEDFYTGIKNARAEKVS
jgi:sulfite reductase (ferredoxin)